MVVPLGPGRFYGSALPRPRVYNDVKFSSERVDPPVSVMDPFLSWAREAHWSMGGLSFQRLRLQGRIEGNVQRLLAQKEKSAKRKSRIGEEFVSLQIRGNSDSENGEDRKEPSCSPDSVPPAPRAIKKRRLVSLPDESDGGEEAIDGGEIRGRVRRGAVRKLDDEFDRVASDGLKGDESEKAAWRTRSRMSRKVEEDDVAADVEPMAVKVSAASKGKKLKGNKSPPAGTTSRSSSRLRKIR